MKQNKTEVQISEIINTVSKTQAGSGFFGFIITFPDGRIENRIIDYTGDDYEQADADIHQLYIQDVKRYRLAGRAKQ